jgi:hypothetical protein
MSTQSAKDAGEDDRASRPAATALAARHGASAPRGQDPLAGSGRGRFGRMFPTLPARSPDPDVLVAMAKHMLRRSGEDRHTGTILSGYTYLGQFIDHDITFDPTSNIQRRNDPLALLNFRTPRFDLDSVYGGGRADQPFLYDWSGGKDAGVRLLLDRNGGDTLAAEDLPRNSQGRALIGDARNDENAIVAQLHLLFIRFHNKVVGLLRRDHPRWSANAVFEAAQRVVRWHYQWLVIEDFLPTVVGKATAACVRPRAALPGDAVIPIEFSGAAFRFGHSLVRDSYKLQRDGPIIPIFPLEGGGEHLGGFRRLKADLTIDWQMFFAKPTENLAMRINTALAKQLYALPPDGASLPELNLLRGRALGLPSGTDVAELLGADPLSDAELLPVAISPDLAILTEGERRALLDAPPLWYYILCEAYIHGGTREPAADGTLPPGGGAWLGPVGGRIVAEVLVGLLERDPRSYLHQQGPWTPPFGHDGEFAMRDLVRFLKTPDEDIAGDFV